MPLPPQDNPQDENAVEYGPWIHGINNRAPLYGLPPGTVADAINGDFDNEGRFSLRTGYAKVTSVLGGKSSFASENQGVLIVATNQIQSWTPAALTPICSCSGPVSFLERGPNIFWTDGTNTGRINGLVNYKWGIEAPNNDFWIQPTPVDKYPADVTVALSFTRSDGVESGLSESVQARCAPQSQITIGNLPTFAEADISTLNVYAGFGETLYLEQSLSASVSQVTFTPTGAGKIGELRALTSPPAASSLTYYRGRIYLAIGKVIWYTDPFRDEHVNLAENYILFSNSVNTVAAVQDGLYVGTETNHYWLAGNDPSKFIQSPIRNYGSVPGTVVPVPNTNQIMWMSKRGVMLGDAQANLRNLQETNVAIKNLPNTLGAAMIRERQGLRQYIAVSGSATTEFSRR